MSDVLHLSIEHSNWLEGSRKIPCEVAANAGLVSKGKDLAFTYARNGAPSFLKVRREMAQDGVLSKTFWIEPKGVPLCLWNEDCLSEASDAPLIITEGEFDALSFLTAGAPRVVSVPNGAAGRPGAGDIVPNEDKQFAYLWDGGKLKPALRQPSKIILATDDDPPGLILRDELALRLGRPRCWYVKYPEGCKDANAVLMKYGPDKGCDLLNDIIADAKPMVPNRLVPFSEIPIQADRKQYSTGWSQFDDHFRLVPPQLIVVTGKPNAGKSEWTLSLVANFARLHGLKGTILQFEDNPERNRRTLLRYAQVWSTAERSAIREAPEVWVDRMFRTIAPSEDLDEEKDYDLEWLKHAIEEAAVRHGSRWILIDPWNEIEHFWGRQDTEATYLNRALRQIKRFARRFQVAIIIVTHPTKEGGKLNSVEDFTLYDINGGAVWNNKADLGVLVWADDVQSQERAIKVAKSKDFLRMGQPGIVRMVYNPDRALYTVKGGA